MIVQSQIALHDPLTFTIDYMFVSLLTSLNFTMTSIVRTKYRKSTNRTFL